MPAAEPLPPPRPPARAGWPSLLGGLGLRSVAAAALLALAAALVLNTFFMPPFPVILGRTLFIAMVLLLAFHAAGALPAERLPAWLTRGLLQLAAVALAAPAATAVVYLIYLGGDVPALVGHPAVVSGFLWIAGTGLVLGILLALGALYRERDAQARSQALQFALERETLQRQAADARLALLQSQVEPHFLFNTLANVQVLVDSGSPRAGPVLQALSTYLRASLPRLQDAAPTLGDELQRVQAYLALMAMRMPDRLAWRVDADPTLRARRVPPMALLTLVENAVRHGIDPAEAGGEIAVDARATGDGGLLLAVRDSGVGLGGAPGEGGGTGLANLRARLQALHGAGASLSLAEAPPHGVLAEIRLPPEGAAP